MAHQNRNNLGRFIKGHKIWLGRKHTLKAIKKCSQSKLSNKNPNWKGGRKRKICFVCQKEFLTYKKLVKCCSLKCVGILRSKKQVNSKNPNWKGGKVEFECSYCNKIFFDYKYRKKYKIVFCCVECRNKFRYPMAFYLKNGLKGIKKQQMGNETSIEKIIYRELKKMKIDFEKQKLIGNRFLVDAFLPKFNTIIEVDGSYWHSLPRVIKKDKIENAYLKKCGYRLLRISENDILNKNYLNILKEI